MSVRPAAVAGTWYPGTRGALAREVDGYLAAVPDGPALDVRAIIAPHAGIMFSGPVARRAVALRRLRGRRAVSWRRIRLAPGSCADR